MLPINPDRIALLLGQARAAQAKGRDQDAEALFRTILALDDKLPEVHFHRAQSLLRLGESEAARAALEAALALRPKEEAIWAALFMLVRQSGDARALGALRRRGLLGRVWAALRFKLLSLGIVSPFTSAKLPKWRIRALRRFGPIPGISSSPLFRRLRRRRSRW